MVLLGQWKDELETHSKPGSISIFVHYGGDRTNDPRVISGHDVILTTYRVLGDAYKTYKENSIYHKVNWHRVVLDEAHSIKAYKSHAALAAFTLTSHCRWCLTGTLYRIVHLDMPYVNTCYVFQNSLEDLFSLLCFLHVEPWGNFAWFNKLVQRPYENGDPRGLKLVKAILKPLMLRRTKETRDKCGRPILVLPPIDIQLIECEQSAAEAELYNALFRKSKHQFDQYVGQGKVLSNYANILELLLRLRQCCNHPFLITSRGDSKKPVDFDILANGNCFEEERNWEFNESRGERVLLMSLKAGGVGLNLTAASNVFMMDPWWNPAVEEQAIMRIHRIGQKRTVHVKRFIVEFSCFVGSYWLLLVRERESSPKYRDIQIIITPTCLTLQLHPLSREASYPPPNIDQGLLRLAAGVEVAAGLLAIVVIVVGFDKWFRSHYPHENDAQTL
ncbi:hypothetical protein K1719_009416 [Acacia pycnantha]|nr:hypothetical protein K1719_009416 [Acacia pycnantha]